MYNMPAIKRMILLDDARAQSVLGYLYYNGEGVPQSYVKAAEWLKKAAAQDDPYAQSLLGEMYMRGQGVSQNMDEAAGNGLINQPHRAIPMLNTF